MRYPAGWKTEQAVQEGVWYRYFLGPPSGPLRKPAVSVTLLAGPLSGSLEDYAHTYLIGNTLATSHEESRPGAQGRSFFFSSPDGRLEHSLLLLQEDRRVYGLYAQGETAAFQEYRPVLDEMAKSLALERPATYAEQRNEAFAFSLRVPPSWRLGHAFSGSDHLLMQFQSPPLAVDRSRQTVHASLTLTVEPIPVAGDLDAFYDSTRRKLGESFLVLSHGPWSGGYVDLMRTETPVASSRIKRFYRADGRRGYSLTFESREDVFLRVARWYDLIATTLRTGSELAHQ